MLLFLLYLFAFCRQKCRPGLKHSSKDDVSEMSRLAKQKHYKHSPIKMEFWKIFRQCFHSTTKLYFRRKFCQLLLTVWISCCGLPNSLHTSVNKVRMSSIELPVVVHTYSMSGRNETGRN